MHHALGILPGEPLDPTRLQAEVDRARARASRTDQWNWVEQALSSPALWSADLIRLETAGVKAPIGIFAGSGQPAISPPDSADTFVVPYSEGFSEVEAVSWTSSVPELVLCIASFQFWRQALNMGAWAGVSLTIRAQIALELDGQLLEASGPIAQPTSRGMRGGGLGSSSAAPVLFVPVWTLPGAHTCRLVAGQAPCQRVVPTGESPQSLSDVLPTTGVHIGSRALYCLRIAMGGGGTL